MRSFSDDRGSAPVEFVLVGSLVTLVTLSVLQIAFAVHVRTTLIDAAAEGARHAALADSSLFAGVDRTKALITAALSSRYATGVDATVGDYAGAPVVVVTVRAPLPLVGMVGLPDGLEVAGRAVIEPRG
jgi:hypothetical protein